MAALEKVPLDILQGMAVEAAREKRIAIKQDMRDSSKQYSLWLAQAEKTIGVLHRIAKPPPRHEHEIHTVCGTVCSPEDMVDQKAVDFQKIWACEE
eukprot:7178836-Pyramimonas_sp.AAC.1